MEKTCTRLPDLVILPKFWNRTPATLTTRKSKKISTLGSRLTAIISVSLALLILGIMMGGAVVASDAAGRLKGSVTVVAKLNPGATEAEVSKTKQFLGAAPWVAESMFTSADDVLAQELQYNSEIKDLIDENPYSAEFEVKVNPDYASPDSLMKIQRSLECLEQVDHVVLPVEIARGISSMVSNVQIVLGAVAAVLLLISVVLIYNTVNLSVYSRRLVIHSMKLVGATPGFIRRPFVVSGLVSGAVAGLVASALLWLLAWWGTGQASSWGLEMAPFAQTWKYLAGISGVLVAGGMLLCCISSFFATNHYIGASYDDYFK